MAVESSTTSPPPQGLNPNNVSLPNYPDAHGSPQTVRIALGAAGGVVVVLGLAQLLLPMLAAQRVRSRTGALRGRAQRLRQRVPRIELLWGHAQSATVKAGDIDMSPSGSID